MLVSELGVRAVARCEKMREPPFSEEPGLLFRPYLSGAHEAALREIESWMRGADMSVRRDPLATLIGRYEGAAPNAPALLIGSHVDSVRDGGAFDGMLGVLLGLACVEALAAQNKRLPFAIEVLGFGDEEGSRFPASMNASRALVGALRADALNVTDAKGTSVSAALRTFNAPPGDAALLRNRVIAFVEPHIEQGPALEAAGLALGVVTSIAGQIRLAVTINGTAGHAGTTPMNMRRDALAAAAEIALAIERIAAEKRSDFVATIGRLATHPGAPNVIPGRVEFTLDVRAGKDEARDAGLSEIIAAIETIATRRNAAAETTRVQTLPATPMDAHLSDLLHASCPSPLRLVSGAGHDAMILARFAPTAMLFIRCKGGVSHHRDEHVTPGDGAAALSALMAFIDKLAEEHA